MSEHTAENDAPCEHPYWIATGDGHTRSGWRCTTCGHWQWIAPWVLHPRVTPPATAAPDIGRTPGDVEGSN